MPLVMVVGHTGCGGCIAAFDQPLPTDENSGATPLVRYLEPIIRLKHSLPEGSDVNDLIKENVKMAVKNVVNSPVSLRLIWSDLWITHNKCRPSRELGKRPERASSEKFSSTAG